MAARNIQNLLLSLMEMTVLVTHGIRKDHSKVDVGVFGTVCWQLVYYSRSAIIVFISIVCFRLVFVGAVSILHL
ncbi:hypothetical protein HAV15_011230 [Penicillium sp. str. |nr:hypothetical protein HAV15_011230 [Penicillium sp. str. \